MKEVLAGLWAAVWQFRWRTGLALLLLIGAKLVAVCVPLVFKAIIDEFSNHQTQSALADNGHMRVVLELPAFLLLGYALLRFLSTLFTELRDSVFARVTLRTVSAFSQRTLAQLLALSPRFHSSRSTGGLIRDVERGTAGIGFLLGAGLFTVLPTLIEFVAVLGILIGAGYSLWFTLAIGVTFFVYAGYTTLMTRRREARQREVNAIDSTAQSRLVDGLLNVETVKTYARQQFELQRFADTKSRWVDASVDNQRALSALHIGQSAIIAGGVATVMLLAGEQTLSGRLSVGDLVLVNSYVIQLCMPLNTLGFVFRQTIDALVDTEKLFSLLRQVPEVEDAADAKPLALSGGEVRFEQIDFAYEPGRPILQDFSLQLEPGQTVAVVGGSGSGKSTLARLLLRLYDPARGRVLLDGQDLRTLQLQSLHQAIGVVSQDTALFNDTIAFNIGYGRPGAGMAEIIDAAKAAQVHEFIVSLPHQYDTVVGERGTKLSGGEKQRIAIARALLKNPPLMIFDEATSALDTRSERAIQGELDRIAQGRTTLVIAHRLSTIVGADQIVVMDRGRIVERGRHQALLERGGLYAQLWQLQLQQREFERLERRLARQPVNLGMLLAGAVDALRGPAEARHIGLYTHVDLAHASVSGDPGALAEAMHAVSHQALRATPEGGRIEISLVRHDVNARLTFSDGRYAQLLPTAANDDVAEEDTPMDPLALRSTIERMGGSFAVEMPAGGRGMRYAIEMPLLPLVTSGSEPDATPMAQAAPPPQVLAGLRVMCVDDDGDSLRSLADLLEAEGATVQAFDRGDDAVRWLEQQATEQWPQLMACDIALSGREDGYAVMRRIRQLEAARGVALEQRLPAIALTGLARPESRLMALMAGFQMHLVKPVAPFHLITALASLAGRGPAPSALAAA